jgi:hypothetical protein
MVIHVPEDRKNAGKAMQALSNDEYLFVCALAEAGPIPTPDAVRRAAKIAGHEERSAQYMMKRPVVLAALDELAGVTLRQGRLNAAQRVGDLLDSPSHKDHFKAVKYVLELGGHVVQSEQKITVDHGGLSASEQRAELRQLMAQMGSEATRVLAAADVAIDADFTVIDKTALAPDGDPW